MGQKRSDLETIPLCHAHHEEQHRIGWPRFIATYQLDVAAILAELREKPRLLIVVKVVAGLRHHGRWFIALYKGQEFYLRPVEWGVDAAIARARIVCGEYLRDRLIQRRPA